MRRNETKIGKRNSGRDSIQPTQIAALEALLAGRSITDASSPLAEGRFRVQG